MTTEFEECDSCGNYIEQGNRVIHPEVYTFALPTDTHEYTQYEFILCTECKRKIVDWIDDCDESEVHVELQSLEDTIRALRRGAEAIEETREELEQMSNTS